MRLIYSVLEGWPQHEDKIFLVPASRGYRFPGGAIIGQESHTYAIKSILGRIGIRVHNLNSEDLIFHDKDGENDLFFYRTLFNGSDSDSVSLGKFFSFDVVLSMLPTTMSKSFERYFFFRSKWNELTRKRKLTWLEPILEKFLE